MDVSPDSAPLQEAQRFDALMNWALDQYNDGNYAVCLTTCASLEALGATSNFQFCLLAGAAYFQLKDFDRSLAYSAHAARLQPLSCEPISNIANVYKETNQTELAHSYYQRALEINPRFADAHGNLGSLLLQDGQTDAAVRHYEFALEYNPGNMCWHVDLGHLYRLQNRLSDAKRCFTAAVELCPSFAIAWSNLACIAKDEGDVNGAIAHYRRAIELDPLFVDAYSNLGNVYKDASRQLEAEHTYMSALALNPGHAIVTGNLAAVQMELGRLDDALQTFERALSLLPDFPDCLSNYGSCLKLCGRQKEALAAYHECLRLTEYSHPDCLNNCANLYHESGDAVTAEQLYRRAIELRPNFSGAHSNLGNLLKQNFFLEDALKEYDAAIACDATFADAWSNKGNCLKDLSRFDDAIKAYQTAISIRPSFADAYGNLASVYKDTGNLDQAIKFYRQSLSLKKGATDPIAFCNLVHCLQTVCEWTDRGAILNKTLHVIGKQMAEGVLPAVQPHHALVYPIPATAQLQIAAHYAQSALRSGLSIGRRPFQWPLKEEAEKLKVARRLRVGYVSSDLGNHPLSHLMQHVFTWHDTSVFEVFCYATSPDDGSEWRKNIQAGVEHFRVVTHLPHTELADMIRADDIDVLVNLNGYTKGSRNEVFALCPAPIQVMYLGFPGSSGASYMQYFVTDQVTTPPSLAHLFTERLAYMPHCYFVNDHLASFPQLAAPLSDAEVNAGRAALGLPPRPAIVYCMFNQLYKIDPDIFGVWMAILERVPGSVLWLLQFPPSGEGNIRREAAARGIASERLIFSPVASKYEHISRGRLADLFIDTPLCNAHTTGTDILWGGVPLITMPGETLASRVGASLLHAMGCPETVASDANHYVELAVALGSDIPLLRSYQAKVRRNRSTHPLFDTKRWCTDWQALLIAMVHDYRSSCARGCDPCAPVVERARAAYQCGDAAGDSVPGSVSPPVSIPGINGPQFDAVVPINLAAVVERLGASPGLQLVSTLARAAPGHSSSAGTPGFSSAVGTTARSSDGDDTSMSTSTMFAGYGSVAGIDGTCSSWPPGSYGCQPIAPQPGSGGGGRFDSYAMADSTRHPSASGYHDRVAPGSGSNTHSYAIGAAYMGGTGLYGPEGGSPNSPLPAPLGTSGCLPHPVDAGRGATLLAPRRSGVGGTGSEGSGGGAGSMPVKTLPRAIAARS